jgi:hypothetical protein
VATVSGASPGLERKLVLATHQHSGSQKDISLRGIEIRFLRPLKTSMEDGIKHEAFYRSETFAS